MQNHLEKVILLVEDSEQDEILTVRALEKNHIQNKIVIARDGAAALEYIFGTGTFTGRDVLKQPQVVLLDLKLPKIDGIEVLKAIRADTRTRRLPVVILTTSNEDRDIAEGYDEGANAYVRKPVDFSEFADAVKSLGLFWLILNERAPTE